MSKYPYISQVDQRDCGVAALAMILKHYGSSYSLAYLRELAQTSREGTSALGLVEAAKQLGLETQAIRADLDLFNKKTYLILLLYMWLKKVGCNIIIRCLVKSRGSLLLVIQILARRSLKCP